MQLKDELFSIASTLRAAGIDYAVCGGLAVAIHGYPRATRDIDLLVLPEDLDAAKARLEQVGYDLSSGLLPFDVGEPTERSVYRVTKVEGRDHLTLDLILVSPALLDVWSGREVHLVEDQEIHVVSAEGLATMKRLAGRPQDLADLEQLGLEP